MFANIFIVISIRLLWLVQKTLSREKYNMKEVLVVGHCDLDNPQITSLLEDNFSAKVTRMKLLKKTISHLEKHNYDLIIINRIGAFDQESGMELIKKIKKDAHFKTPLMMVTNYKVQMD